MHHHKACQVGRGALPHPWPLCAWQTHVIRARRLPPSLRRGPGVRQPRRSYRADRARQGRPRGHGARGRGSGRPSLDPSAGRVRRGPVEGGRGPGRGHPGSHRHLDQQRHDHGVLNPSWPRAPSTGPRTTAAARYTWPGHAQDHCRQQARSRTPGPLSGQRRVRGPAQRRGRGSRDALQSVRARGRRFRPRGGSTGSPDEDATARAALQTRFSLLPTYHAKREHQMYLPDSYVLLT